MPALLLVALGCTPPTTSTIGGGDTSTAPTGDTSPTGDTGEAPTRPATWYGFANSAGRALEDCGPWIAIGAPSIVGQTEDVTTPAVYVWDPMLRAGNLSSLAEAKLLGDGGAGFSSFGAVVACPGNVTGDGVDDIIVGDLEASTPLPPPPHLFAGPVDEAEETIKPDATTALGWPDTHNLVRCGDVSGDGQDDLCTSTGVAFGPVVVGAPRDVTWLAVTTPAGVRVASADLTGDGAPELVVTEPDANLVHHLVTLPAGDHALAAIAAATWTTPARPAIVHAGGDLSGDGVDDLIVGWQGGLAVAIDTAGGDLQLAHATLPLTATAVEVGDLDGDGQGDLIVGTDAQVYVFLGPIPAGKLAPDAAVVVLQGAQHPDDEYGAALLAVDVDGDADDDLIVGAPRHDDVDDSDGVYPGRVYRYLDPLTQ